MKFRQLPSKEYLDECFDYSKETGTLIWKARPVSHFKNETEVKLSVRGVEHWGGYHQTLDKAKEVYKNMAMKYHGEYANCGEVYYS